MEALFREFFDRTLLQYGAKLNKTAWKILKGNKNKQNIKALKRKRKEILKIC